MALSADRVAELQAEAADALEQLGTPESVLIFDFSVGTGGGTASKQEVQCELTARGIDLDKLAKIFKRPADLVLSAIAGKAAGQGLSVSDYLDEFAAGYRHIGLPVFVN